MAKKSRGWHIGHRERKTWGRQVSPGTYRTRQQGGDEVPGGNEVDPQLTLNQALAVGHVVELRGTVAVLGDQVVEQLPLDVVELVDEDAVDVQPGVGPGEVTLETIVERDVFGVDIFGLQGRWGGLSGM